MKVLNVVDVSYGGENGFSQAIELSAEILSNVKFIQVSLGRYWTRQWRIVGMIHRECIF